MKRTGTGKPVLSWSLIVRNDSENLERCLKSVRAVTPEAEIVVVDTMSGDDGKTRAVAEKYADVFAEYDGPNHTWTRDMYAFDDAAAARNRALELSNGSWIGWIDSDDELVSPEETQRLLMANGYLHKGVEVVDGLRTYEEAATDKPKRVVASLEDYLELVTKTQPEITAFNCPYLYRFAEGKEGEAGKAAEWQQRERFVKVGANGLLGWRWHRKAHEYLAPNNRNDYLGMRPLKHMLFVHRKLWTAEDVKYSYDRHYKIVRDEYDKGVRNYFDLFYLVRYAPAYCPDLIPQFMSDIVEVAVNGAERAQALTIRGNWRFELGFGQEALEDYVSAATVCDPRFPEPYVRLARAYEEMETWGKAVEWYMKATKLSPDHAFYSTSPREHFVVNRIRGAMCAFYASKASPNEASMYLKAAVELAEDASKELGADSVDKEELKAYLNLFRNELRSFDVLNVLAQASEILKANDETLKAAKLVDCIPHNVVDHPVAQRMASFKAKMDLHEHDFEAYTKFYESEVVTGMFFPTDETMLMGGALPRVKFLCAQLKALREKLGRPLNVLEVGPWDGVATIPAMEALSDSKFTVIEVQQKAVDQLLKNAEVRGVKDRLSAVHGMLSQVTIEQALTKPPYTDVPVLEFFDAVVFFEVLEHLPDPSNSLALLHSALTPKGRLFLSTPWGAYDRGYPENMNERDARGHVVALMPRDVVTALKDSGFRVLETGGSHNEGNFSDTLHVMAEPARLSKSVPVNRADDLSFGVRRGSSPQFLVTRSLWPWNATHVENTGIGASEETIVFLARELGRRGGSPEVYGTLPRSGALISEEVRDGVAYWPKEQLRHFDSERPLVISRSPGDLAGFVNPLLKEFGKEVKRAFLWLQDCYYPDLTPEVAATYEKIIVLTEKHANQVAVTGISREKLKVIPNFLLKEHFPDVPSKLGVKREPHRFIYCSSPDRGLIPLLNIWPLIRKHWPDATLGVFYGWQGAAKLGSAGTPEWMKMYRKLRLSWDELKRQPGVEDHGRVNHAQIAHEMRRASVWSYPIFNSQVETFCSNGIKARAAGCVPVVTAGMVPDESLGVGSEHALSIAVQPPKDIGSGALLLDPDSDFKWNFVKACEKAISASEEQRDAQAREAIDAFELGRIFPLWEQVLG